MSYLVMARKWRPLTFEDVVNQDHVKRTLANAIKAGRIAHAYLFSGPRGIGKTTVARILAKALNCENGPTAIPCNECSVCREIMESRSLDVLEIDGASNRGIDEVRNLRENIKYAPLKSKFKIYIIDEVHMLTDPAFNALLKTLEEPPVHVVFIFATTAPQKIPATILSRCQRFDFRRISAKEIVERLSQITREEKISIDDEALVILAKKADGSLRDAESLLDQMASFTDERITSETVRHLLGVVDQEFIFRLGDIIAAKDVPSGLDVVGRVIDEGMDIQEFFKTLAEHLRNLLVAKSTSDASHLIDADEGGRKRYREQAVHFSEGDILRMIRIVSDHEFNLRRSPLPRLELEMAVLRLIKLDSSVSLEEVLNRLEAIGDASAGDLSLFAHEEKKELNLFEEPTPERRAHIPVTQTEQPQQETEPVESTHLEPIRDRWNDIVQKVKKKKMGLGTFLGSGTPTRLDKDVLTVSFAKGNGFSIEIINRDKKIVTDILHEEFGKTLSLECIIDETQDPAPDPSSEANRPDSLKLDAERLYENEPIVKKIVDVFDGKIVQE
ncbi:MAG: DNA polymerase III subunit gamma/tau [Gemmatimonadota bacterium]|nr:MAG: DNA polymerase III subunit gamma/tau [Gemmatimonadota bacterium]